MSYAKEKGKELENWVADQIVLKGLDARAKRDGASGASNREKGDVSTSMKVLNQNAGIECKNANTIKIPEWWRQAQELEQIGREPMLVFKIKGTSFENSLCVMYLDTILELIKASQSSQNELGHTQTTFYDTDTNRELKYAISSLKVALSKVNKLLEND